MKLYFENNVTSSVRNTVSNLLNIGQTSNGKISLDYIPEEELECYEDSQNFIKQHIGCEFNLIVKDVKGTWGQPICMVAIEE